MWSNCLSLIRLSIGPCALSVKFTIALPVVRKVIIIKNIKDHDGGDHQ